jgi:hypothetical protein
MQSSTPRDAAICDSLRVEAITPRLKADDGACFRDALDQPVTATDHDKYGGAGSVGSDRRADGNRSNSTNHDSHSWCSCWNIEVRSWRFAGIYGEGRSRTADTTIFSRVLYQLSYLAGRRKG